MCFRSSFESSWFEKRSNFASGLILAVMCQALGPAGAALSSLSPCRRLMRRSRSPKIALRR